MAPCDYVRKEVNGAVETVQDWCRDAITDLVWPLLIMEHDLRASDARSRFADPECWP